MRHAVERGNRGVPSHDTVIEIHDQQTVVEGLENVLVERAHAIDLDGLQVELAIEPGILERRGI